MTVIPYSNTIPAYAIKRIADNIDKRIFPYLEHAIKEDTSLYSITHHIQCQLTKYRRAKLLAIIKQNKKIYDQYVLHETDEVFHLKPDFYPYNKYRSNIKYRLLSDNLQDTLLVGIREMYHTSVISAGIRNVLTSAMLYANSQDYAHNIARNYTIRKDGAMTFMPKHNVTELSDDDCWKRDKRNEIKHGRAIRTIFELAGVKNIDKHIEYLTHYVKSQYTFNGIIKIHPGRDIWTYYNQDCYQSSQGSLNGSCMKYSECSDMIDILADNAEIIVAHSKLHDGLIIGRALLWTTACGSKVMDRIYGNETTIQAFKEFAKENNFIYKAYQTYSSPDEFIIDGKHETRKFIIKANPYDYEQLPYMDTFKYYNNNQKFLNNQSGTFTLENTDGSLPHEDDSFVTIANGDRIHEDDATFIEGRDEWYHNDDVRWSDHENEYIHEDDAVDTANHGIVHRENYDFVYVEHTELYHHDSEVIEIDHEYYVPHDIIMTTDNEVMLKDDVMWSKIAVEQTDENLSKLNELPELFNDLNVKYLNELMYIIYPFHNKSIRDLHKLQLINNEQLQHIATTHNLDIEQITWRESNT